MDNNAGLAVEPEAAPGKELAPSPPPLKSGPFFERTDWQSFCLTTALILAVYLVTLSPDVGLGNEGIFTTGAMYGGVPHPAGFPLWTIYAHFFTVLLPFFNIAWRVSVSSAVAGALTCGLIALLVSRLATMFLEGLRGFKKLDAKSEKWLRIISGYTAGMAFGLDNSFWWRALVPDLWPFSLLLFAATVCLLLRWRAAPERTFRLYTAVFVYGLALTNSQSFLAAALGIEFLILSGSAALGRDLFAVSALFLAATITGARLKILPSEFASLTYSETVYHVHYLTAALAVLVAAILIIKTRALFTKWKTVLSCAFCFALGLSFYFYVAVASMTNPPMNWGYPRTVEGFFHVITREQYERVYPVDNWGRFLEQIGLYGKILLSDYGWPYLLPPVLPFFFLRRMRASERNTMLGLLTLLLFMSFLCWP